jgi:inorganic pyrophosphatase
MADFNKILTPGNVDEGMINVVIEIPTGSSHKIEWNRELATMQLDRVEPAIFAKPTNYGFIPQTLDEDGDELDVLLVTDEPLPTGVFLEARIIGVMEFADDEEVDDKIYKDLKKPGTTVVQGWGDIEKAKEITKKAIERWNEK